MCACVSSLLISLLNNPLTGLLLDVALTSFMMLVLRLACFAMLSGEVVVVHLNRDHVRRPPIDGSASFMEDYDYYDYPIYHCSRRCVCCVIIDDTWI